MAWSEYRAEESLAAALGHLRTRVNITKYVQMDTSGEAAAHTDTVNIPVAGGMTDTQTVPTAAPYVSPISDDGTANVRLTEHRRADFAISDKDASTSAVDDIVRTKMLAATDALASRMASFLFTLGNTIPNLSLMHI